MRIDIAYCGVCHSDVHRARDEMGGAPATNFPCMPGHEIVGVVAEVGSDVTRHAVGDRVGVGCLVYWGDESRRGARDEQYQQPPAVFTYNAPDPETDEVTFGGYSDEILVHEHFVLRIPDALDLAEAAPLLCAGVTAYAPLTQWGAQGKVVGIAGLGGLGHLAVKLAKALGAARVVALTTTADKAEAARASGAGEVIVITDEDAVEAAADSLEMVLSTIPTAFDMKPYLSLLGANGVLATVGMLEPIEAGAIDLGVVSMKRLTIGGSLIGNLEETQEVLDFCAEHGIAADIEKMPVEEINEAFEKVVNGEARFRFVIDSSTLPSAG